MTVATTIHRLHLNLRDRQSWETQAAESERKDRGGQYACVVFKVGRGTAVIPHAYFPSGNETVLWYDMLLDIEQRIGCSVMMAIDQGKTLLPNLGNGRRLLCTEVKVLNWTRIIVVQACLKFEERETVSADPVAQLVTMKMRYRLLRRPGCSFSTS